MQISIDELVDSENSRRHITLKREHEDKLYNFNSNLSWGNIVAIFNNEIKHKLKSQSKFLDFSESSNLEFETNNNNNINENENNNSIDIDIISLGKR